MKVSVHHSVWNKMKYNDKEKLKWASGIIVSIPDKTPGIGFQLLFVYQLAVHDRCKLNF